MREMLLFFSPTSCCGFSGTSLTLFWGDTINLRGTFTAVGKVFLESLFLFQQLIVSFLANCRHFISFLLAGLARGLILPFLYAIIKLGFCYFRLLLRAILTVTSIFVLPILIVIFSPFYRQLFNLLPLLLCFYYSTLACMMSRVFQGFFIKKSSSFPQAKQRWYG